MAGEVLSEEDLFDEVGFYSVHSYYLFLVFELGGGGTEPTLGVSLPILGSLKLLF